MARKDALLRLHQLLLAKRDTLRERLKEDVRNAKAGGHRAGDVCDEANKAEQTEIDSQIAALESRELVQVDRAIHMIRQGTYGTCEVCSHKIPIQRLKALPFTPLCINCQREMELNGQSESDFDADWSTACEFEGRMSQKELTLGDIDLEG